jgi:hypothetical protein
MKNADFMKKIQVLLTLVPCSLPDLHEENTSFTYPRPMQPTRSSWRKYKFHLPSSHAAYPIFMKKIQVSLTFIPCSLPDLHEENTSFTYPRPMQPTRSSTFLHNKASNRDFISWDMESGNSTFCNRNTLSVENLQSMFKTQ